MRLGSPCACSARLQPLGGLVGTNDYTEAQVSGGHIGILVSRQQKPLRERIVGWLEKRDGRAAAGG